MLIVVLIAFNNPELMNAWDVLFTLDKRWLLLCLLAMVGYVYAEGAGLCTFLRMEGYKVSLNTATHFSFAGIYYANVTPGSSGGQPMQIYLMSQRSIPAGVATSALTARYFFNQLTLVVMTLLLWLSNRVYVAEHLGNVIPLIILGCVVNSFCVPSILLVTFHRSWVEKIVQWGIRFLTKIHICKKPEQWQASAETTIEHFPRFADGFGASPDAPAGAACDFGGGNVVPDGRAAAGVPCHGLDRHAVVSCADGFVPAVRVRKLHAPAGCVRRAGGRISRLLRQRFYRRHGVRRAAGMAVYYLLFVPACGLRGLHLHQPAQAREADSA